MARSHLSEYIAKDRIVSRHQFFFDEDRDFLDEGGYSQVYKATLTLGCSDTKKARKESSIVVAAKVLVGERNKRSRLGENEVSSLRKEAAILLRLEGHRNIVQLIAVCEDPTCYALLLEYISDGNLKDLLLGDSKMMDSWEKKLDVSRQIADGMHHLHSQSPPVIHLDLKTNNVLYERKPNSNIECKITDFGLSKTRGISSQTTCDSEERCPAGTVAFIAPERYQKEFNVSDQPEKACKADVYSYGIMLWQIMVRKQPFQDEPIAEVIRTMIKSGTAVPSVRPPDNTPRDFVRLMESCYSFAPGKRPIFEGIQKKLSRIAELHQKRQERLLERNPQDYKYLSPSDDVMASIRRSTTGDRETRADLYELP